MLMDHMGGPLVNLKMFREYLVSKGLVDLNDILMLI